MKILYIDTSSSYLYTAIVEDNNILGEIKEEFGQSLSEVALPKIASIFTENNIEPNEVNKIIVVNGPGSFTGIRIGITIAKSSGSDVEGLGFAIPIDIAKSVVNDLVENGRVSGRLVLGISYYEINSLTDALKYGVNAFGLLVEEVVPNSNAYRAGIRVNDVIVEVDGKQIATPDDLRNALSKHKIGDTMTFVVLRDRKYVELKVVLK